MVNYPWAPGYLRDWVNTSPQIARQTEVAYLNYKKIKEFEDVGYFLQNYIVSGGFVTKNIRRNDEIDISDTVFVLDNDVTHRDAVEGLQLKNANSTYYVDIFEGDFWVDTAHPQGTAGTDYLPLAVVTTDANGNVDTITDAAGVRGGFRLKPGYMYPELEALTAQYTSSYPFQNAPGDAELLKQILETSTAHTLYVDSDIYIDQRLLIDGTKIKLKKIQGLGGVITYTNKGRSQIPCIQFDDTVDLVISDLNIQGDIDQSLINPTDWFNFITSPLHLNECTNMRVHNNTISSVISAYTICIRNSSDVVVSENSILNCWYRNSGDTQGDAIYISFTNNSRVINNYIYNNFTSKDNIGRGGIIFEFNRTKNFICTNNYIYGYDRAIHCELVGGDGIISHNISEGCAMAYVGWQCNNNSILIENNYFSNAGIPVDHFTNIGQAGWGFISMFTNTIGVEVNANTIFRNNTFELVVNVTAMVNFVSTKITGEEYIGNYFIDQNLNKELFLFNPNDSTINNNRLVFRGNHVKASSIYFGNIGRHIINENIFDVGRFIYNCMPTPSLNFTFREFCRNTIRNGDGGIVNTLAYAFMNKVSLLCSDNVFRDIAVVNGEQNTLIRVNQDYTSLPYLKSVFDGNTLLSTQAGTVTNIFFGRADPMVHPTTTNKRITSGGVLYEQSGLANRSVIVTSPDGTERYITVDNAGALSTVSQRFK